MALRKGTSTDMVQSPTGERGPLQKQQSGKGFMDLLDSNSEQLITMMKEYLGTKLETTKHTYKFRFKMSFMALALVTVIIGSASFLTYIGKIDGSTFTFLLGLVVGYVLTYIRDSIGPDEY